MCVSDDYNSFTNCTKNGNEDNNIIVENLLLPIPAKILLFSLIGLMICTLIKPLLTTK